MTDQRPDTSLMTLMHDAMRRDLGRTYHVLATPKPISQRRRTAVLGHLDWVIDFLDHHHHNEDSLWPLVRARRPDAAALLDQMDADHSAIESRAVRVTSATAAYRSGDESARGQLAAALAALLDVLSPHLGREEREVMPIVSTTLTQAQWHAWEDSVRPRMSIPQLADALNWFIDDGNPQLVRAFLTMLPKPVVFISLKVFGVAYRRKSALRWSESKS